MKVLLVNGSPHKNGCTHRALQEIQMQLKKEAIDSEIFWIGSTVQGCIGCCQCQESGTCVFDDILKIFLEKAKDIDGFIFGSAVYYGSSTGSLSSLWIVFSSVEVLILKTNQLPQLFPVAEEVLLKPSPR